MAEATPAAQPMSASTPTLLPRVAIQFCTQCKWMLRAAYFAQELLSTFSTSIGEVALQPSTGGTFTVTLTHLPAGAKTTSTTILWDRKTEGGFPETKVLKRRLRDVIQPDRDLGHVDRTHAKPAVDTATISDTQASDAVAAAPTMASSSAPSALDVVSQLKKHPANADKAPAGGEEPSTTLSDAARDAIGAARANTGQKAKAEISPAGQLPGQRYDEPQAKPSKKCEDCD